MKKGNKGKFKAQTHTILKVEDRERGKYILVGGIIVLVIYFILSWL